MGTCHNIALVILVCVFAKVSSQGNIEESGDCTGVPQCTSNPCDDAICPNHPQARCKLLVDTCGNCKATFFTDKGDLKTSDCFKGGGSCQPCKPDPCAQSSCPLQPGASCSSDTCKGCVAEFTFGGEVLTDADCMLGSGPSPPCPDGSPSVRCPNNPCDDAACNAEPEAECRPNSCGGCSAHFYVENRRISDLICLGIEPCPPGTPRAGCVSRPGETCLGQTCSAVPDAKCIIDGCRGCNVIFHKGGRRLTEEDCQGCPTRECDPCANAKCPDFPNARCEPRRCGQCQAVFYGPDRNEIQRCCKAETCNDGSLKFHCKKDPCDGATCRAFPKANCRANNCGGCKGEFFLPNGNKLSDLDCVPFQYCPPNVRTAKCSGDNCLGETCPRYPGAQCKIEGCNGCRAIFYFEDKRLTREDCHGCPNGDRVPECLNPCEGAFCEGNRGARCEPQVCGECKARFYGRDRKEITSCSTSSGTCPRGSRRFNCVVSPCKLHSCPGVGDAECRENYCGGCNAEFYYKDSSNRIPDYMCVGKESCPGDLPVAGCDGSQPCLGQTCPNFPEAQCYVDGCNGCHVTFYSGRRRLTREDCHGCPAGAPRMSCGDLCKNSLCPLYPDARCEPRACGRCSTVFYGLDRREIADCCAAGRVDTPPPPPTPPSLPPPTVTPPPPQTRSCPGNKIRVPCSAPCIDSCEIQHDACIEICDENINCICPRDFVEETSGSENCIPRKDCSKPDQCPRDAPISNCKKNPCDGATCPGNTGAICRPNYCGGCFAEFYFRQRKLTDLECVKNPDDCAAFTTCDRNVCNCPARRDAQCVVQYCPPNTCKPLYFDTNGKKLSYGDCGLCEDGTNLVVNCGVVPPCLFSTCPAYPKAECRVNNCGICQEYFVDSSGNTVDCEKKVTCKVPSDIPHGVVSPNDRNKINVGELVIYRCDIGFLRRGVARRTCVERRGRGRLTGAVPKCFDQRCPKVTGRGSSCTSQCNSNGECGFKGMCCWNGCASTCVDTPSPCRDGLPERQCFANPCDFVTCTRYPSATCKPDYCGGCFRKWYAGTRKLQPDDCEKPTDSRCPPLSLAIPLCLNLCSSDSDCSILEVCCYNGCGHRCLGY